MKTRAITVITALLAFNIWSYYRTDKSKSNISYSYTVITNTNKTVMNSNTITLTNSNTEHGSENYPHLCDEESYYSRIIIGHSWRSR
jgi:hypothetical protein